MAEARAEPDARLSGKRAAFRAAAVAEAAWLVALVWMAWMA